MSDIYMTNHFAVELTDSDMKALRRIRKKVRAQREKNFALDTESEEEWQQGFDLDINLFNMQTAATAFLLKKEY